MKIPCWLIAITIAANVALGCIWYRKHQPVSATTPVVARTQSTGQIKIRTPAEAQQAVSDNPAARSEPTVVTEAGNTKWKDLLSTDLKEHIVKLRAASCPEETIQDIIVAEVDRIYAAKTRELWPERYKVTDFWQIEKNDPVTNKKNRESWRKEREMQKEKSALLVELLGFDPEKKIRQEEGWDDSMDWQQSRVAFLPEAKREVVLKYLEDFDEKMQDFHQRNQGLWDAQSRAEQKQLEKEKLEGLAQFLTPQELRDFELHSSQLADQLRHDLQTLSLSQEQYEQVYDIRKKYGDSIYNYGDIEGKEARDQVEANQKELKNDLLAALGPVQGKEYERSQDYSYQQLNRLAKRYDLPADTATKVYDMKETAEQTVKQLQANKELTDQQRQDTLWQVRQETEASIKEALGEKNFKRYQREGGWWINNLAPKPKPAKK